MVNSQLLWFVVIYLFLLFYFLGLETKSSVNSKNTLSYVKDPSQISPQLWTNLCELTFSPPEIIRFQGELRELICLNYFFLVNKIFLDAKFGDDSKILKLWLYQ